LRGKFRDGELKSGKLFREAAKLYLREFDIMTQGQRSPTYARGQHANRRPSRPVLRQHGSSWDHDSQGQRISHSSP
jgi:hypothetical protein